MSAAPRILVVDDEEDIRNFIDIKLTSAGLNVLLAADGSDIERGLADGATDYVIKPFSPQELLRRINAALAPVPARSGPR